MLVDQVSQPPEQLAALITARLAPHTLRVCRAGCLYGAVDVLWPCQRHPGQLFTGRRIVCREGFARLSGDPLAVDEQLLWAGVQELKGALLQYDIWW